MPSRADEAIARCGLNGGAPAPAPKPAPAPANVISVGVVPGQPTVDVPVGPQVFRIPDINKIIQDLFSQAQSQVSQLSSF